MPASLFDLPGRRVRSRRRFVARGGRILALATTLCASAIAARALPVFPGAVGFGTDTPAGRGGTVYRVTNLANDGPGSLRHGVEGVTGPRVIIFDVSGVIRLESDLMIRDRQHGGAGFLTIAGQTAPAPGITLANAGVAILTHDVLIQHIAIRPGDRLKPVDNRDCIKIGAQDGAITHHIVLDHVSASWAVDETVSTWSDTGSVADVTFSSCVFAHPVINGGHSKGSHGYGPLIGRNSARVTLARNLIAFATGRTPLIRDRVAGAQVVNNFVYHPGVWSNAAIYVGDLPAPPHAVSVVGNVIRRRALPFRLEQTRDGVRAPVEYRAEDYRNQGVYLHRDAAPGLALHLHDNRVFNPQDGTWYPKDGDAYHPDVVHHGPVQPVRRLGADPFAGFGAAAGTPWPSTEVEGRVLAGAGKTPTRRDAIDARLIADIRAGGGFYLEDLAGEDPWAPVDLQHRRVLELPARRDADDDGDGYTNLEEWLHQLAADVEGRRV